MYTNTESTEKPQYINVETYLNQSWAEAVEEEQQEREVKPKTAWATIQQTDDAPGLADIVAEEQKRANAAAAKKQAYRPPVQTTAPTPGAAGYNKDYYRSSPRSERPTTPREKVPIPNEPPYTAFIGNLHYSVAESHIREFFEELGIETVQLLKAEDGQSKGFGYIRFESRDGLEKALLANGHEFHGRPLNMDVAKPLTSKLNTSWGTGGRDSFRGNTGNRPAERDTTWGSGNRERGSFRNSFTRPPANRDSRPTMDRPTERPTERPKSMQNPPQHSGLHEIAAKPKGSYSENPFGTNLTPTQIEKMNQLANDRLQKEKERDEKKRAEEKKRLMNELIMKENLLEKMQEVANHGVLTQTLQNQPLLILAEEMILEIFKNNLIVNRSLFLR